MQKRQKCKKKAKIFFQIAKMYMQKKSRKYYFKKTGKKKVAKKGMWGVYPTNVIMDIFSFYPEYYGT